MTGQADLNPELVDAVAAIAAETFFKPLSKPDGLVPLEFWQLGPTEQTRWRRIATNVLGWMRAEKERRAAQAPKSPGTSQAGPLFTGGATR